MRGKAGEYIGEKINNYIEYQKRLKEFFSGIKEMPSSEEVQSFIDKYNLFIDWQIIILDVKKDISSLMLKNGAEMKVRYNKLWKLLIDKGMKKSQLREAVGASKSTFAKLGKNENVTLPVLLNICEYLECDFGDIMEAVPENEV